MPRKPARILLETAPEALIGDVDERQQSALGDDASDLVPLVVGEVGAGRIMAAAVKQHDVARTRVVQRIDHRLEADGTRRGRNRDIRRSAARPSG